MKKLVLLVVSCISLCGLVNAQAVVETKTSLNKVDVPALAMTMDYSKKIMEEAVNKHFKDNKLKGKSSSGVMLYSKITYSEMCVKNTDVYTKVDGSSKTSTIYIMVQRENGNFVVPGDEEVACIKDFLNKLSEEVVALDLKYQIEEQKKVYEKSVKDYDKLVSKKEDLQKQLKDTEKAISEADANMKKQKSILNELEAKSRK
ncbi:MAG: hypothetical protein IKJ98_05880 [Bacteroidales bacterium]|nr:hypothetical protein [Bacteroidales bacterium]